MINNRAFFCFLALILVVSAALGEAAILLNSQHIAAVSGAIDVHYPVYLTINQSFPAGFQFEVSYPLYLIYKNISLGNDINNATFVINDNTAGMLKIAGIAENINSGEIKLFDILFDINESAVIGVYDINFSNQIFTDINTTIIPSVVNNGLLEIVPYLEYNVTFLPPITIKENFTLQEGATLPLKFNVTLNSSFIYNN